MAKVYTSSVIDAPADQVWQAVRDFNGLPDWHPAISESRIEGGAPAECAPSAWLMAALSGSVCWRCRTSTSVTHTPYWRAPWGWRIMSPL